MNQPAVSDEAREVQLGHFDPYKLDPSHIHEPPTSFGEIVKQSRARDRAGCIYCRLR